MADLVKGLFGGSKPAPTGDDSGFADFKGADAPAAASSAAATPPVTYGQIPRGGPVLRPYTKWYRVWERTSAADFKQEAIIIPVMLLLVILHAWGRRKNKRIARNWAQAHAGPLVAEYAVVGFGGRATPSPDEVASVGLAQAMAAQDAPVVPPEDMIREKTAQSFTSYSTGRQNVAFVDVQLTLFKRYNPLTLLIEYGMSLFFESMPAPMEQVEYVSYAFDGNEAGIVPVSTVGEQEALADSTRGLRSTYDPFVWAVVHKDYMRTLREERYDVSLTSTKDLPQLPAWASIMTESAEITDTLLTPELIRVIESAGEDRFKHLIVTDQPIERPTKLADAAPRKRISLALRIPSGASSAPGVWDATLPLFRWFLRFPDILVQRAHFRPEVTRKVRQTRDQEIERIRRRDDEEKAEERKAEADRKKKAERDAKLKGLSADEQRKFLDKEREKGQRKQGKKMTARG